MSIIVEALKKAQGSLKTNISSRGRNTPPLPPPEMRKPRIKKHAGVWIFASFLLLAAVSFYFLNRTTPAPTIADSRALKEEESPPVPSPTPTLAPSSIRVPASVPAPAPVRVTTSVPATAPAPTPAPAATSSSPPLTLAVVSKSIDLDGIMHSSKRPLAVINGSIWGEGDYIGKFKISKIEKDFVKITSEGQEFIIRLRRR